MITGPSEARDPLVSAVLQWGKGSPVAEML